MSVEGLEHYSKDELVEELINRQTFVGVLVYHRGNAKAGRLEPGEIVITKSPPLTRQGVAELLQIGETLVPGMFQEQACTSLPSSPDSYPLNFTPDGAVRIGDSRISLDIIVEQYENGMSPEEIVRAYDTLQLADVYAAVAYYLRHHDAVSAYLRQRDAEGKELKQKIEAQGKRISREELIARSAAEKEHAASRQ